MYDNSSVRFPAASLLRILPPLLMPVVSTPASMGYLFFTMLIFICVSRTALLLRHVSRSVQRELKLFNLEMNFMKNTALIVNVGRFHVD